MPRLKFMLDQVLEQRMLLELSEKKHDNTKVNDLDALLRDLKNALYEAEEIFDLIDYHRIEKEVGNDIKASWLQWCWQRIYDSTRKILAPLLQWVKQGLCWLWHWVRIAGEKSAPFLQLAWQGLCWLGRCVPRSEELLPVASTASASSVQRISLWVRFFDFKNFLSNWLSKAIEGACYYRDWSYNEFGFKSYQQRVGIESNCTVMGPLYIILKKNMEKVENLIDEAQEIISLRENLQETIAQPKQSRRRESDTYISNVTTDERQNLGLHLHSNANRSHAIAANSRAAATTATPPSVVIGLDKDCDKIVAMLHEMKEDVQPDTNSAQCYSVIGIHGVAGSGKSTLVQLVCAREKKDRQEKKDGHFDLVMWVHVSQYFSVDAIFKEMFEAATGTSCPHFNNLDTLQSNLEKELHGKRFLLVLDDVWYSNRVGGDTTQHAKLQQILSPLNAGKAGSKILVTSRKKDALLALGVARQRCIPISFLDDDVFLNLFMHYALYNLPIDDLRGKLEDIGKEIAKKLKGLPLAAKIVGGQLCIRQNLEFWRQVRDRNLWSETMGALWWSYQLLDEEVRQCFAYCSIFPRRRGLERDELAKLWAAQGFAGRGNEGEDICRNYFDELVSASFLQLRAKERPDQKNDCYVVHDLLYDLAEKVTGSDCLRIENLQSPVVEVPPDVRHVFLQTYDATLITEKVCKLGNLRTLIIDEVECVEENVLKSMFERLRKLRVLIMSKGFNELFLSEERTRQFSLPASIGQLRHLRYLAFRVAGGGEERTRLVLPGTLTKLYHMQVLDCDRIQGLVFSSWEGIFGLINLRHLIGPENLKIPNIGRLTSLQSMRYFAATKEQGYELKQLGNLNKLSGGLCISCLENVESPQEALEAKLADMEGLRGLSLHWYSEASPEVQTEVLEGLCPPNDLESLTIYGYKGLRYPSWMVGRDNGGPKYLKHLKFSGWIAEPDPELRGFFTHLCMLTIRDCSWQALPDCMEHLASLQKLMIYGCRNIQSFPTLPPSLQFFELYQCNEVLMSSCKTIGDPYWRKIQHIPYTTIGGCKVTMELYTTRTKTACKHGEVTLHHQIRHLPSKGNLNGV